VKPTNTPSLDDSPNAMLNLVTCYPLFLDYLPPAIVATQLSGAQE
jgi:sortase (surface protein transpeptidase)